MANPTWTKVLCKCRNSSFAGIIPETVLFIESYRVRKFSVNLDDGIIPLRPFRCYYIAVVPLPGNVSIDAMPSSREIIMDTMANAYANNLHGNAAESKRLVFNQNLTYFSEQVNKRMLLNVA